MSESPGKHDKKPCGACEGVLYVRADVEPTVWIKCPDCNGTGTVVDRDYCQRCKETLTDCTCNRCPRCDNCIPEGASIINGRCAMCMANVPPDQPDAGQKVEPTCKESLQVDRPTEEQP